MAMSFLGSVCLIMHCSDRSIIADVVDAHFA